MKIIRSAENKLIKYARRLIDRPKRDYGCFVVEGKKFVLEIPVDDHSWQIEHILLAEDSALLYQDITKTAEVSIVANHIFEKISDTVSPQGMLAIVRKREFSMEDISDGSPILLLEDIRDPGNLGTILRTAYSAGASGLILSPECVNIYSPKVVWASASAIFHLPFITADLRHIIPALQNRGNKIFAASSYAHEDIYSQNFVSPCGFVIGNEAQGISDGVGRLADSHIRIPAKGESLNAAVAASIMLYEAFRQRI